MGETRQPQLNGAYYGPSIPPPSKSYHRPSRRGGGGCCCNPFSCCCDCIMNCICACVLQLLCVILVTLGVLAVIVWFVFRPNIPKFHATDATLAQFDYNNNTLHYNLAVNLTIRNPNRRVGIYYDKIEARAFYKGQRFAVVELDPFFQGLKSTNNVSVEFKGQSDVVLGGKELGRYNDEKRSGLYEDIDVKLFLKTRLKFWFLKSQKLKPKIGCDNLKIPMVNSNGTVAASQPFVSRRCDFDWH